MKKALEDKDTGLTKDWKDVKVKSKATEDSLKGTEELKKSNESLKKAATAMNGEITELKKIYSKWDKKFKDLSDASAKDKKELNDKVTELLKKKAKLEEFAEHEVNVVNERVEGFCSDVEEETEKSRRILTLRGCYFAIVRHYHFSDWTSIETATKYVNRLKKAMQKV